MPARRQGPPRRGGRPSFRASRHVPQAPPPPVFESASHDDTPVSFESLSLDPRLLRAIGAQVPAQREDLSAALSRALGEP